MSDSKGRSDQNQDQASPISTRRNFLATAAGVALATTLPSAAQESPKSKKAPAVHSRKRPRNVLFIMSDDMRAELA